MSDRHSTVTALLRWIQSGYHQLQFLWRYLASDHLVHSLEKVPYRVKMKVAQEVRLRPLCFRQRSFLAAGALYGPLKANQRVHGGVSVRPIAVPRIALRRWSKRILDRFHRNWATFWGPSYFWSLFNL